MSMSRTCHDCQHCKSWYFPATREDPGDEGWECTYPWPEGWEPEEKEYDELEAETCIHFEAKQEEEKPKDRRSILDLYQETYDFLMQEEF
jgi:hypothetical protein